IYFQLFDVVQEIKCPDNLVLPCTTTELSPEFTGQAIVDATCFDSYIPRYSDHVLVLNPERSILTRTFSFTDAFANHQCKQEIWLDCTVSSEDVYDEEQNVIVQPNPLTSGGEV